VVTPITTAAIITITIANDAAIRSGLVLSVTPRITDSANTTTTCADARIPAENDFPRISAERGVGVTSSLVRTPASRSQMIWMP
jgi:hypothetical protein